MVCISSLWQIYNPLFYLVETNYVISPAHCEEWKRKAVSKEWHTHAQTKTAHKQDNRELLPAHWTRAAEGAEQMSCIFEEITTLNHTSSFLPPLMIYDSPWETDVRGFNLPLLSLNEGVINKSRL